MLAAILFIVCSGSPGHHDVMNGNAERRSGDVKRGHFDPFWCPKKKLEKRGVVLNSRSEAFIKEYSIKRREKSSVLPKVRSPAKVQKQDTIATKTRRQRKHRLIKST